MARFDEILRDCTKLGTKIPTDQYLPIGSYPIIDQGQTEIAGYCNNKNGLFEDVPAIIFGDHTRAVKYVDKPCFLGADGVKLLCPVNKQANVKYLYYQLQNADIPNTGYNRHFKWVKELDFIIPTPEEQEKVVATLDQVTTIISLRKRQIAKLDELVKARFVEMFGDPVSNPKGWSSVGLLELGSCKNGMNFHTDDSGVEVHCLGVGDFKNKSAIRDTSELPLVSLNEMPSGEYLLQDGDIVFVRSNGNKALVGRCLAVFPGKILTTFSGFCIRFRKSSDEITTEYLIHVLKTESMRKMMQGRGANIQNLNQQILGALSIPVPPVDLQNRFSEFVAQVDKSKLSVQNSLNQLETLKKALMQKYFW